MTLFLAHSSAWVECDRATGRRVDLRLSSLIQNDGPLATTEPVIMEIMAGFAANRERRNGSTPRSVTMQS